MIRIRALHIRCSGIAYIESLKMLPYPHSSSPLNLVIMSPRSERFYEETGRHSIKDAILRTIFPEELFIKIILPTISAYNYNL